MAKKQGGIVIAKSRSVSFNGEQFEEGMEEELFDAMADYEDKDEKFSAEDEKQRLLDKGVLINLDAEEEKPKNRANVRQKAAKARKSKGKKAAAEEGAGGGESEKTE